jgi:hypothetical protein
MLYAFQMSLVFSLAGNVIDFLLLSEVRYKGIKYLIANFRCIGLGDKIKEFNKAFSPSDQSLSRR